MGTVIDYNTFFWLGELRRHIKQFESEGNEETARKLLYNYKKCLTSIKSSAI